MKRRTFIQGCFATPLILAGYQKTEAQQLATKAPPITSAAQSTDLPTDSNDRETNMYGLIAKINAKPGNRDKLIEILLDGTKDMPGCKLYAISADIADETSIWITEIWDFEKSHKASLQLPSVQKAITNGKPLIASFDARHVVIPVGGIGIEKAPNS